MLDDEGIEDANKMARKVDKGIVSNEGVDSPFTLSRVARWRTHSA